MCERRVLENYSIMGLRERKIGISHNFSISVGCRRQVGAVMTRAVTITSTCVTLQSTITPHCAPPEDHYTLCSTAVYSSCVTITTTLFTKKSPLQHYIDAGIYSHLFSFKSSLFRAEYVEWRGRRRRRINIALYGVGVRGIVAAFGGFSALLFVASARVEGTHGRLPSAGQRTRERHNCISPFPPVYLAENSRLRTLVAPVVRFMGRSESLPPFAVLGHQSRVL